VPRIGTAGPGKARATRLGAGGLVVDWPLERGDALRLVANLGPAPLSPPPPEVSGRRLFACEPAGSSRAALPAWHVAYYLEGCEA